MRKRDAAGILACLTEDSEGWPHEGPLAPHGMAVRGKAEGAREPAALKDSNWKTIDREENKP